MPSASNFLKMLNRPLICTEYMARRNDSRFWQCPSSDEKTKRPELLIGDLLQERQILFLPGMTSFRRVKNRNYGFMISIVLPEYLISRKKSIVFNP